MQTFHGTIVDIAGQGVLLRGPSASGKSDLALRLIDRGATLVADDRYLLRKSRRGPVAFAPDDLYGLLEVRGVGIVSLPAIKTTLVKLVVDLLPQTDVPRLPENQYEDIQGVLIPKLSLNAFESATPIKIELVAANPDRIGAPGRQGRQNG